MRKVTVRVTAKDLEEGEPSAAFTCPIARAISRTLKGAYGVSYEGGVAIWVGSGEPIAASKPLPANASRAMKRIDNRETVRPFSFTIMVP